MLIMVSQNVKKNLTRIVCFVLAALMVLGVAAIILFGCSPSDGSPDVTTPISDSGSSAAEGGDFKVLENGAVCAVVRPDLCTDGVKKAAVTIRNGIKTATGIKPKISDDFLLPGDTVDENAYEILVGETNRPESADAKAEFTNFNSFSVAVSGRKLLVLASDDSGYTAAAEWLCDRFYEYADRTAGTIILPSPFDYGGTTGVMLASLPLYETKGKIESLWDCGDECSMYIIKNTNAAEYNAYDAPLVKSGYKKYAENKIGDNLYATYTSEDGKYVLNTVYTAYESKTRLIIEPLSKTALPTVDENVKDTAGPVTVTQVGLEYQYDPSKPISEYQIGMLYIVRLRDGRFIIIDGGYNYDKNLSVFMNAIKKLAADPAHITVAAWIFSHAHGDHIGLFTRLANSSDNRKVFTVENFIFNFPSRQQYDKMDETYPSRVYSAIKMFPGAKIIKAHPGQKFGFGGAEIEYYSTIELVAPRDCDTGNTTSAVFSLTAEGQKIMFLGDSSSTMTDVLVKCYGKSLASDIVQVAHHGAHGGSVELYKLIDMKVAFWPLGVWDYYNYGGHGRRNETWNAYLISSPKMMEIILAGHSERTITLPYNPTEKTFPPANEPKD